MRKGLSWFNVTSIALGFAFLYLPILLLVIYSFNASRLVTVWAGFSTQWYWKLFQNEQLLDAAWVTLPLSRSGIIAGCMLVMIPAVGEFVIPELLGGPDTLMIGRLLWAQFFNAGNWPMASAVAIVMLLLLMAPILLFHRFQQRELEGGLE